MTNITFAENNPSGVPLILELEEKIDKYSRVPHYVLITGERGTGKTTIAKRLHRNSERSKNPFVNLNCASLTGELLESELFGYEKGAFTGATSSKAGLFEIAGGGTIFLDEIGEIPLGLQAKLLKAVEEKRIRRVGSNLERSVDTRIIAATSQNLEQMIKRGHFRADLFDRLNILRLETVPLKFQKEKIIDLLHESLIKEQQLIKRKTPFEIAENAIKVLLAYEWGGNFRELHNFATRIAVECSEEEIVSVEAVCRILAIDLIDWEEVEQNAIEVLTKNCSEKDLPTPSENLLTFTIDPNRETLDSIYLKAAGLLLNHFLEANNGKIRRTAKSMGLHHATLLRLMTKSKMSSQVKLFPALKISSKKVAVSM
ncbi:MAG TPA: sigma 54-interacting transcriptional regulator [Pyrinomonadaceae bacterium]|nr:sigma 54-interacting transcriptional regulator [Pyrinomonadaceae bacterium]